MQFFWGENTALLGVGFRLVRVFSGPKNRTNRGLTVYKLYNQQYTETPRLTRILGPEKNRVRRNRTV